MQVTKALPQDVGQHDVDHKGVATGRGALSLCSYLVIGGEIAFLRRILCTFYLIRNHPF